MGCQHSGPNCQRCGATEDLTEIMGFARSTWHSVPDDQPVYLCDKCLHGGHAR